MAENIEKIKKSIRNIPDFPKPGILFRDITPLLNDIELLRKSTSLLAEPFKKSGIEAVAAVEARGFIFGSLLANELNVGFVPIRKKGKLPFNTVSVSYDLEYGTDQLEAHKDAVKAGAKVLVIDDVLATGGTAKATVELVEKIGGNVAGIAFLIELSGLKGREKISKYNIHSLIQY
ncbi:adenine phosphoribosyltransferase [Elusimicrobiota bacterium]